MDFRAKCRLVEKCLPESPYRAKMTSLHDEMLEEIEHVQARIYGAEDMVAAEREACAKVCETPINVDGTNIVATRFANAIRARSNPKG